MDKNLHVKLLIQVKTDHDDTVRMQRLPTVIEVKTAVRNYVGSLVADENMLMDLMFSRQTLLNLYETLKVLHDEGEL